MKKRILKISSALLLSIGFLMGATTAFAANLEIKDSCQKATQVRHKELTPFVLPFMPFGGSNLRDVDIN